MPELIIKGIKCDAAGCGWRDDSVTSETLEDWRNRPCPMCGSNLLTDADWRSYLLMNKILHSPLVRLIEFLGKLFWKEEHTYRVDMNGTGDIAIKEIKEAENDGN